MLPRILSAMVAIVPMAMALAQEATSPKYEEVLTKMVETLDGITKTLEMIVDEESAKSQTPELREKAATFLATRKQSESVAPPSPDERDRLAKAFRPQFEKSRKDLIGQIARVQRVPGGVAALQAIRGVFEKSIP